MPFFSLFQFGILNPLQVRAKAQFILFPGRCLALNVQGPLKNKTLEQGARGNNREERGCSRFKAQVVQRQIFGLPLDHVGNAQL
jgi:hypothetical protein